MARRHLSAFTPTADGPLQAKLDEHDTALDSLDGIAGASLSNATPANIGTAAAGVATSASRSDHVHAIVRDFEGTVRARAASNMGVSEAVVVGRFVAPSTGVATSNSGSVSSVSRSFVVDHAQRQSTGGGAGAFANANLSGYASGPGAGFIVPKVILPGATRWWIGAQIAFNVAVQATGMAGLVLAGGDLLPAALTAANVQMVLGMYGPSSIAKFYLWGAAGTPIDTGVNIDANAHRFEAWSDGTSTYASVDGVTTAAGDARPAVKCALPHLHVFDSASQSPALSMDVYWAAGYVDGGFA